MGVDGGNLQVIDVEVIVGNYPIVLLYSTYLQVANIVVFIIHTIIYLTFVTSGVRDRTGSYMGL